MHRSIHGLSNSLCSPTLLFVTLAAIVTFGLCKEAGAFHDRRGEISNRNRSHSIVGDEHHHRVPRVRGHASAVERHTLNSTGLIQIYLINLTRRRERLDHMSNVLRNLSLPFTRFPAVDGQRVDFLLQQHQQQKEREREQTYPSQNQSSVTTTTIHDKYAVKSPSISRLMRLDPVTMVDWGLVLNDIDRSGGKIDFGQVGAWQSHLQVMLKIVRNAAENGSQDGPVLVMEDDVDIVPDFVDRLTRTMQALPPSWEVLAVGHFGSHCAVKTHELYCRAHETFGMHGYILRNASTVHRLLPIFNSKRFQIADYAWQHLFRNELAIYVTLPRTLISQNFGTFGSDIPHSGHDFDQFLIQIQDDYSWWWKSVYHKIRKLYKSIQTESIAEAKNWDWR